MMRGFSALPGAGGGGGGETPDCGTCLKNAWNGVPAWNRAILIVSTVLYLLSLAVPQVIGYTICVPVFVYQQFEGKFELLEIFLIQLSIVVSLMINRQSPSNLRP